MSDQGLVGRTVHTGVGDQEAGGDRDDKGWNLGNQAVANGHQGVGRGGVPEGHSVLEGADQDPAYDVDRHNDEAGDGVPADELGGAVHGAKEGGFLLKLLAPPPGLILVDQTRRQVCVDRHLLPGQGVEGEPGGHLGDPSGTLGDDDEVHDHQDGEDDDPDGEVAAGHQPAKGLDHLSRPVHALMAMREDQSGRRHIQGQAE